MKNNLTFHYQTVLHGVSDGIYIHEAFSTSSGELYSVNPSPVMDMGDTEEEIEENINTVEADSTKYKPVKVSEIKRQIQRWRDEQFTSTIPSYEDEENLEEEYLDKDGEVLDLVQLFDKNK